MHSRAWTGTETEQWISGRIEDCWPIARFTMVRQVARLSGQQSMVLRPKSSTQAELLNLDQLSGG